MLASDHFRRALKDLPRGELARISEETGLNLSYLTSLRAGRTTSTGIDTFARIARAMGRSADELLGLTEPQGAPNDARVLAVERSFERYRRRVERVAAAVQALVARGPSGSTAKKR